MEQNSKGNFFPKMFLEADLLVDIGVMVLWEVVTTSSLVYVLCLSQTVMQRAGRLKKKYDDILLAHYLW